MLLTEGVIRFDYNDDYFTENEDALKEILDPIYNEIDIIIDKMFIWNNGLCRYLVKRENWTRDETGKIVGKNKYWYLLEELISRKPKYIHPDPHIITYAVRKGKFETVKALYEQGFPISVSASYAASAKKHYLILKWLMKNSCPIDEHTLILAVRSQSVKTINLLIRNKCKCNKLVLFEAIDKNNDLIISIIFDYYILNFS